MFWAVQGMAAELSTGIMVSSQIRERSESISMLVAGNNANFSKKATGKIIFSCLQGVEIDKAIALALKTGEGQSIVLKASGYNEENIMVSDFAFTWSIKLKSA